MKPTEIDNFYKTASKEQIHRLVESRNDSGANSEILTEIIHAANHEELWEDVTVDQMIAEARALLNGKTNSK
jgi:hypothetical protein